MYGAAKCEALVGKATTYMTVNQPTSGTVFALPQSARPACADVLVATGSASA